MMYKFALGQPIQYSQLQQTVQQYVWKMKGEGNNHQYLLKLKHKQFLSKQRIMGTHFLKDCILYCLLHQLSSTIQGLTKYQEVKVSERLREVYFQLSAEGVLKKQFDFQQALVCVTKIISQFYSEMFVSININAKLQSQIFIVLVYALMGIKVGTKCFQLLEKKFLNIEEDKANFQAKERRKTLLKRRCTIKDSNQNASIMNSSGISSIAVSKLCLKNQILKTTAREPMDSIRDTLKQSLYIDPLPKIKKPKTSIQLFDSMNCSERLVRKTCHNKVNHSFDAKNMSYTETQKRNKSLYSTQISLALKSQICKRNVCIAQCTKPFKIKHRMPHNSTHQVLFKSNVKSEVQLKKQQSICPKDKVENKKLTSQQWYKAVKNIKQVCTNSEGIQKMYSKPKQDANAQMIKNQNSFLFKQTRQKKYLTIKSLNMKFQQQQKQNKVNLSLTHSQQNQFKSHKAIQKQAHSKLQATVKNFKQIPIDSSPMYFEKPKKTNLNKKNLRQQKSMFDFQTKQRNQKIQYSMFMLPSMLNKVHKQTNMI